MGKGTSYVVLRLQEFANPGGETTAPGTSAVSAWVEVGRVEAADADVARKQLAEEKELEGKMVAVAETHFRPDPVVLEPVGVRARIVRRPAASPSEQLATV